MMINVLVTLIRLIFNVTIFQINSNINIKTGEFIFLNIITK